MTNLKVVLIGACAALTAGAWAAAAPAPTVAGPAAAAPAKAEKAASAKARVLEIRVADTARLTEAVTELGTMCANPMLSMAAVGSIMKNPFVETFGPMRTNANATVVLYADVTKLDDTMDFLSGCEPVIYYPAVRTRAKFLRHHPDAVETNGCLLVDGDWIRYSEDGLWLVSAPSCAGIDRAMGDLDAARAPLAAGILTLTVPKAGCEAIRRAVADARLVCAAAAAQTNAADSAEAKVAAANNKANEDLLRKADDILRGVSDCTVALDIGSEGLSLAGSATLVPGTEVDKIGRQSLPANPLAFAPAGALLATAIAADCGGGRVKPAVRWAKTVAWLADKDLDVTGFIATESKGPAFNIDLDVAGAVAFIASASARTNACADIAWDELAKIWNEGDEGGFVAAGPAQGFSFSLRRAKAKTAPSEVLAATFPDFAGRKIFGASAGSLYGTLAAIVPVVLEREDEETRAMVAPLLSALPDVGKGGVGSVNWRDGAQVRSILRFAPDELKGLGALVNLWIAKSAAEAGAGGDDADEEDEGDEKDADGLK